MTYKEIVDRVRDIANRHKMIIDFGYGNLSDIKTNGDDAQADYPYVFLNPQSHTRTGQAITYRFNMIVMEMAKNDVEVLEIQSNCQQYIDDILAELRFGYTDQIDLTLNVALTPFKERFQDTVAGMTANLEIVVPQKLNQCIAPIVPAADLLVHATNSADQLMGPDAGDQNVLSYDTDIVNDGQWIAFNKYVVNRDARLKFVIDQPIVFNALAPGEAYPSEFVLREITSFVVRTPTVSNWPDTIVPGQVYNLHMEWEDDFVAGGTVWEFFFLTDQPGDEGTLIQKAGGNVKIYEINE